MTKKELEDKIFDIGGADVLDDLVHDAASSMASKANNGGVESQIDFLVDNDYYTLDSLVKYINEEWGEPGV